MAKTTKESSPISVDVSAKAEIKGTASTAVIDKSIQTLVDAFSPFSEGLGLVGDHIRAHRYDIAIKIAKRARQLAQEENIELNPPPLKFSVPFIEKASMEVDDKEMTDMWARLLLDASSNPKQDASHLIFMQILSLMTSSEAKYLKRLIYGKSISLSDESTYDISRRFEAEIRKDLTAREEPSVDVPPGTSNSALKQARLKN